MQQQELTKEQASFLQKKKEHIQAKIEPMLTDILGEMLKDDLPYVDIHYIYQRALEVVEKTIKKVLFMDEKVRQARLRVFSNALVEVKKKKKKIELVDDERSKKCERVVQVILDKVLDREVMLSNPQYFNEVVDNDEEIMMYMTAKDYLDFIYNDLVTTLSIHERNAYKYLMDGKEREEVTMGDLDRILKESIKAPKK